uniref:Uncharacterized protein n=1 Tax=Arundo donax TaxID=35708 RepID=A0A0A8Y4C2_ARUDO
MCSCTYLHNPNTWMQTTTNLNNGKSSVCEVAYCIFYL